VPALTAILMAEVAIERGAKDTEAIRERPVGIVPLAASAVTTQNATALFPNTESSFATVKAILNLL